MDYNIRVKNSVKRYIYKYLIYIPGNFQYTSILEGTTASFFFLFVKCFFFRKVYKEVERVWREKKEEEEEEESLIILLISYLLYLGEIKCC